jgi:hypothetical protein
MKEFSYFMTINEQQDLELSDHFEWIYFDPERAAYDTLRPQALVRVTGESKINQAISSSRLGGLYDLIEVEDNKLLNQGYKYYFSALINGLLILAVGFLGFLMLKKK